MDDAEVALAQVWREVLGVERVGRHDHFFGFRAGWLGRVASLPRVLGRLSVRG